MDNSMAIPQNLKADFPDDSNPTPGHISRKELYFKKYMHPYVHRSTIHNTQDTEAI